MTTTVISIGIAVVISAIALLLILRSRKKSKKDLVKDLEQTLKDTYDNSATELVKAFKWYFTYDPKKPMKDQTPYNRAQRRMIQRHYKKFLFQWWEIPKGCRNIDHICNYLVQGNWKTNVVERYVDIYLKGKHEEGYAKRKERLKKEEEERKQKEAEERRAELEANKPEPVEIKEEEVEDV